MHRHLDKFAHVLVVTLMLQRHLPCPATWQGLVLLFAACLCCCRRERTSISNTHPGERGARQARSKRTGRRNKCDEAKAGQRRGTQQIANLPTPSTHNMRLCRRTSATHGSRRPSARSRSQSSKWPAEHARQARSAACAAARANKVT